jgi:hypothetical protein
MVSYSGVCCISCGITRKQLYTIISFRFTFNKGSTQRHVFDIKAMENTLNTIFLFSSLKKVLSPLRAPEEDFRFHAVFIRHPFRPPSTSLARLEPSISGFSALTYSRKGLSRV